MEFKSQISWGTRGRSTEFKANLDYALKRQVRPSRATPSIPTQHSRFSIELNTSKESRGTMNTHSGAFSHYNNLQKFRNFSGLSEFKKPSGAFSPGLTSKNRPGFESKEDFFGFEEKRFSERKEKFRASSLKNYLDEVISIGTLSKAMGIVKKGGLFQENYFYSRRLKEFCLLILNNIDG
jgi:hypothetical protein